MSAAALSPQGAGARLITLRAAWQSFANPQPWWAWVVWAALLVGSPLAALLVSVKLAEVFLCVFGLITLAGAWGQLVSSTLNQNHPSFARLMPGHPRRLRLTLVLSFLALAVAAELAGQALHASGVGLATAASLAFIAAGVRWPLLWAATGLIGFMPMLPRHLSSGAKGLLADLLHAAAAPLGLACVLAAVAIFLASLVRDGDGAHQALYERLQKRRRAVKSSMAGEVVQSGWCGRLFARGYLRDFERTLASADAGHITFERQMLALGPQAHASTLAQGLVVFMIILAIVFVGLRLGDVFRFGDKVGEGFANSLFGLLGVLMGAATQLHASVIRRRNEQALVSLLPGVLRGRAFNRRFALALMARYLALWAIGAVVIGLVLLMFSGTQYALIAFSVTLLGGGLVLLRDWTGGALLKGWMGAFVYLPISIAAMAARWAMESGRLSIPGFLLIAALVLLPLYAWRWRAAMRAPMAWPAGRRG